MKQDIQTRLELLKKYHSFDEKNKLFNIALHYEKVSDIFIQDIRSISNVPLMNEKLLDDVSNVLESIPNGYSADISLSIDDYEGHDEKTVMESFNDMLEFGRLRYNSKSSGKYFKVATLLVVGLILLFIGIFAEIEEWWHIFGKEMLLVEVFVNFLEISGWVFCWEAVSILFLEDNDDMKKGSAIISKLHRIILLDKDNKVLIDEKYEQIQKHFYKNTPLHRVGSLLLIFSGFAFIGLASMVGLRSIPTFEQSINTVGLPFVILNLVWIVLAFLGGLFAIQLYLGKEKYRIPAIVFALLNLIIVVFAIVFSSINGGDVYIITTNVVSGVVGIAYLLGFFFTLENKKNKK